MGLGAERLHVEGIQQAAGSEKEALLHGATDARIRADLR